MISRLLVVLLSLVPPLAFASNEVNWSFCESDSQCKKCIEKGSVVIEKKNNKIVVSGKSPLGTPVTGELSKCDFKSDTNWTCIEGRMRVVNQDSKVKIEYTGRPVSINGKQLEFCSVQVR